MKNKIKDGAVGDIIQIQADTPAANVHWSKFDLRRRRC